MVETVKLDKCNNYLFDKSIGAVVDRYDPHNSHLELVISVDNSILRVDSSKIKKDYGGQIIVQHNNDRYIIDDGHQNVLIKAGYIVYKDYDIVNEYDVEKGKELRTKIINDIRNGIEDTMDESKRLSTFMWNMEGVGNQTKLSVRTDNFDHTIYFDTISNIVTKNHERMNNALPYYPFQKGIDKYGALYVSSFALKTGDNEDGKYHIANAIISDLMMKLGPDYHFITIPINRRVILTSN